MFKQKTLVVLRSWPGAGKSYLAKQIKEKVENMGKSCSIFSTDDLHYKNGQYVFQQDKLGYFHKRNFWRCFDAIAKDDVDVVIVDNTNIKLKEFKHYCVIAALHKYDVVFAEPNNEWSKDVDECAKRTIHGVPKEVIQRMMESFENTSVVIDKLYPLLKEMYGDIHVYKME